MYDISLCNNNNNLFCPNLTDLEKNDCVTSRYELLELVLSKLEEFGKMTTIFIISTGSDKPNNEQRKNNQKLT